jgi:hypothetical protein
VINFLGQTVDSIVSCPTEHVPFGKGPWPCLNKVCIGFKEKVIIEIQTNFYEGSPVGYFSCNHCGFTYVRRGPDQSAQDVLKVGRVDDYGWFWNQKLLELSRDENISVNEMARILGVDPHTVKVHLQNNKQNQNLQGITELDGKRNEWLEVRKSHPEMGTKALYKNYSSLCSWLSRYDPEWFHENKPDPKRVNNRLQVNWAALDDEISLQLPSAIDQLHHIQGRPIRITRKAIGRKFEKEHFLERHLNKLPRCKKLIEDAVENTVEYSIRRLHWANDELLKDHHIPSKWRVLKKANITGLKNHPEIIKCIKELLYS